MESVEEAEIPQYFLCPISLQIMRDPVTAATGITYDRHSIEHWLKTAADPVCPVTKQPLPRHSDLTPNHTLRRLIQAWCVANSMDRIPTPKPPLARAHVLRLLRGPELDTAALDELLVLASSVDHQQRRVLVECGVHKAMVGFIVRCYAEQRTTVGMDQAMKILINIWDVGLEIITGQVEQNFEELLDSLTWVLNQKKAEESLKTLAILLTKEVTKVVSSNLKPEFFKAAVKILTCRAVVPTKAALQVLLNVFSHGRNKYRTIEANAVFHLIQLQWAELGPAHPDKKRIIELGFCLLDQLCSCAEGRAQFLAHPGGIAILSKRILRVSPTVDDRAVHIFGLISKYSATKEILQEMLAVGAVSKLCMILQTDSAKYLKDKVREMLRMHNHVWNNSPCIQVYLLTRYPMLQF